MGFDQTWVPLVMRCITSVRFTVLLNGKSGNPFKPSRGIRQGDPISAYIFILVSDVLSVMLNKAVVRGIVQGIRLVVTQFRDIVGNIMYVNIIENPGKYLGLPTMWGRSKREAMNYVKETMMGKVEGWKQKLLTQADREILIKAVAQAIPTYPMYVFLFPGGLCRELDGILAKF
ncbi:hypothetical protein GBA52_016806 [Prunus armeniaca]|nr:hypothetical protein GBA52_016806 [Prunus armeniaca]